MTTEQEKISSKTKEKEKENSTLNLLINVVFPTVILIKFSTEEYFGPFYGFIVALSLPLLYGLYDLAIRRKTNFFSILGLVSILITGGIGLLELDKKWMVVKETSIPLLMGLAILIGQMKKKNIIKIFFNEIIDLELISKAFEESGHKGEFDKLLYNAGHYLAGTFFISAILNFVLAIYILEGNPGTEEFNKSLGKMTALSFPVISVPMMILMGIIMSIIYKSIKENTNLEFEKIFRSK